MKVRAEVKNSSDDGSICIILSKDDNSRVNIGFYTLESRETLEKLVNDFNRGFKTLWH